MNRRALLAAPLALAATPALASEGGGAPASTYLRYPTITANTFRPDGRRGVMTIEAGVDVADPALLLRARQSEPRVRAVFAILAQREAATLLPGQPPNVDRLSRQYQSAMNIILGQRGATLLLGTVMVL
ncbi:Tat pathway signal protein [Brevundimonas subvibrioides]|uniref:Tat pathway signal protein n=1 Tax=Brevundimonas subvibrioides TaxID=74313 RepID=UPI0022B57AE9|nr:Tat pathway signal protein [Brevundimonas subvibrioides]